MKTDYVLQASSQICLDIMTARVDLQYFLPYLLNRAGLRIGLLFLRRIEGLDVTLPMWRVMIELWRGGNQRLSELSLHTSIDQSTLSRLLVSMQRKKLIERRKSVIDGRALNLSLTSHGRQLTKKIIPHALHYENIAMRDINRRDGVKLKRLLRQIYESLEAADRNDQRPSKNGRRGGRRSGSAKARPPAAKKYQIAKMR
jgi:DNA-binding MarR family transcriptional regulator